jgi:hypothetical protein
VGGSTNSASPVPAVLYELGAELRSAIDQDPSTENSASAIILAKSAFAAGGGAVADPKAHRVKPS